MNNSNFNSSNSAASCVNPFGLKQITGKGASLYVNITTAMAAILAVHMIGRYFGVDVMTKVENVTDSVTGVIGIKPKNSRVSESSEAPDTKLVKATSLPTALPAGLTPEKEETDEDLED